MKQLSKVVGPSPTTEIRRVYYLKGTTPVGMRGEHPYAVKDPPTSGYAIAVVTKNPGKRTQIFCPVSLQAFDVPPDCAEVIRSSPVTIDQARLARHIVRRYVALKKSGVQVGRERVNRVLHALAQVEPRRLLRRI